MASTPPQPPAMSATAALSTAIRSDQTSPEGTTLPCSKSDQEEAATVAESSGLQKLDTILPLRAKLGLHVTIKEEETATKICPPNSPMAKASYGSRVGRHNFKRIRQIGYGAVGKVFLVKPVGLPGVSETVFAMKRMKKADILERKKAKRVLTEQSVLAKANHPFVCTLFYSFQTKTKLYHIMQFCAGGEFFRMLKTRPEKRLEERHVKFYAAEILVALEYIHLLGFFYRDLKPENILIHATGHVMLTDFDLSKAQAPDAIPKIGKVRSNSSASRGLFGRKKKQALDTDSMISIDRTMSVLGTVEYMPREMLSGKGYGSSADWWSYGILIYEMLYGCTPFKGKDWETTLQNIRRDIDLKLPDTPVVTKHCRKLLLSILSRSSSDKKKKLDSAMKIKKHKFFRDINFQLIRDQTPPIVPKLNGKNDLRYFYSKKPDESDLSAEEDDAELSLLHHQDDADEDGFEPFNWSCGTADPHWTLDPTIKGSPAARLHEQRIRNSPSGKTVVHGFGSATKLNADSTKVVASPALKAVASLELVSKVVATTPPT